MAILVVYGFHAEELKFGLDVCSGVSAYNDVTCYQIQEACMRQGKLAQEKGYSEISELLKKCHPDLLVDLHHSIEAIPRRMRSLGKGIAAYRDVFPDLHVFSFPLVLFYENPRANPRLETHLINHEFCSMYYSFFPPRSESNIAIDTASNLGIPYIGIEAMISENEDGPIEDEDYFRAKESFRLLLLELTAQTHQ